RTALTRIDCATCPLERQGADNLLSSQRVTLWRSWVLVGAASTEKWLASFPELSSATSCVIRSPARLRPASDIPSACNMSHHSSCSPRRSIPSADGLPSATALYRTKAH